jgi:hypothetical protein
MKFLALSFLIFLTACMSISPTQFVGPNGKEAYSMRCSGMGRSMEACYQKAGQVCPSGYNIVSNSSSTVGYMYQGTFMMAPKEQLTIECR